MRLTETSLLAILSLLLAACTAAGLPTPEPVVDSKVSIPTPASTIIGRFVWQIDGLCGYQMLRPESWTAAAADCRVYRPPGPQGQNNRLTLRVVNYQLMAEQKTGGLIAQFELFRTDPSLEGWTKGMEQTWQDNGIKSALETTLSRAKIYSLQSPGSPDLQLAALVIDQKQPLALSLYASGEYANQEFLRTERLLDDFIAMVRSLRATGYDPGRVSPSLLEQ